MDRQAVSLFFVILLFVAFAGGCVDELTAVQNETVNVSDYEISYFGEQGNASTFNETTFYLTTEGFAAAVYALDNASSVKFVPMEDMTDPGNDPVSDLVILAEPAENAGDVEAAFARLAAGQEVSDFNYTIEDKAEQGQTIHIIDFNRSVTGFVAFKMNVPMGQDFMYVPTHDSVVRIVLPAGYTTGNPFIGKIYPDANYTYYDDEGRQVFVWENLVQPQNTLLSGFFGNATETPVQYKTVYLTFYTTSATTGLLAGTVILSLGALAVVLNYLRVRRKLRKQRMEIEEEKL
jgi:hypothetical protein